MRGEESRGDSETAARDITWKDRQEEKSREGTKEGRRRRKGEEEGEQRSRWDGWQPGY